MAVIQKFNDEMSKLREIIYAEDCSASDEELEHHFQTFCQIFQILNAALPYSPSDSRRCFQIGIKFLPLAYCTKETAMRMFRGMLKVAREGLTFDLTSSLDAFLRIYGNQERDRKIVSTGFFAVLINFSKPEQTFGHRDALIKFALPVRTFLKLYKGEVPPLMHLCRMEIRESIRKNVNVTLGILELSLPNRIKEYLLHLDGKMKISELNLEEL